MLRTISRRQTFWLAACAVLTGRACAFSAEEPEIVVVKPGQDIQAIVARSPEGTRFRFEPGLYRGQTIYPRNGQRFIGQDGVILSGATELTCWTRDRGFWRADDLPGPLHFHGDCGDGRELCNLREDLFVDGRLYERVGSFAELGPGRWYYAHRRAYLADDPSRRSVELGTAPLAFGGDAADVVLQDLTIERYASDAQHGAIDARAARGWRVLGVTARCNHGAGLAFGPGTLVDGGSFSHNGQLGIAGTGASSIVEAVEIAFNNYAGYNPGWEAGGTKFWQTRGLVVRNCCIHHNAGPGLWADTDNIDTLYDGNQVFMNAKEGIKHEISYAAIIRNNRVTGNATGGRDNWLWGAQILVQNSSNVDVHNNSVELARQFGNGIAVIDQDRGTGAYGPWRAINNSIHHNTIVHCGPNGQNGVVTDTGDARFWREAGNSFDWNTYVVADGTFEYWRFHDHNQTWSAIKELGYEANGTRVIARPFLTELFRDQ
jgi:hypothetical protein